MEYALPSNWGFSGLRRSAGDSAKSEKEAQNTLPYAIKTDNLPLDVVVGRLSSQFPEYEVESRERFGGGVEVTVNPQENRAYRLGRGSRPSWLLTGTYDEGTLNLTLNPDGIPHGTDARERLEVLSEPMTIDDYTYGRATGERAALNSLYGTMKVTRGFEGREEVLDNIMGRLGITGVDWNTVDAMFRNDADYRSIDDYFGLTVQGPEGREFAVDPDKLLEVALLLDEMHGAPRPPGLLKEGKHHALEYARENLGGNSTSDNAAYDTAA